MHKKDFDGWNERKKQIHQSEFTGFVHEREVWWCSIGVNIGQEEDGKNDRYERPVLILKKFSRSAVLAIPLSTKIKSHPFYFGFSHESNQYAAIISQLRLISTKRLSRRIYKMDDALFLEIKEQTRKFLE